MNASAWIRQTHRWLAIVFTLTVIANFAVRALGEPPAWITYSPLPPLACSPTGHSVCYRRATTAYRCHGSACSCSTDEPYYGGVE